MKHDEIQKLKALALAATSGKWMRLFGERTVYDRMEDGCRGNAIVRADTVFNQQDAANLDFVAAANPATILSLIAQIEARPTVEDAPSKDDCFDGGKCGVGGYCEHCHHPVTPSSPAVEAVMDSPIDEWQAYARRKGLLDESGVAPNPAQTQVAYNAYCAAWNRSWEFNGDAPSEVSSELSAVVEFLCGAAPLEDIWFGNDHPGERGKYWWRERLRAALSRTATPAESEHDEPTHKNHPDHHDGMTCEHAAQVIVDLIEAQCPGSHVKFKDVIDALVRDRAGATPAAEGVKP